MFNTGLYNQGVFNGLFNLGVASVGVSGILQYNGFNIPNPFFVLKSIPDIRSVEHIRLSTYDLGGYNGLGEGEYKLGGKDITIEGYIIGSDTYDLENNIRTIQSIFVRDKKPLYCVSGGTILYTLATCIGIKVNRNKYHINYVPCEITLVVNDPLFRDLQAQEILIPGITGNINQNFGNAHGSYKSQPNVTIVCNSISSTTTMAITIGSNTITITDNFVTGDTILIDSQNKRVFKNSTEILDYTGTFLELDIGENNIVTNINGTYNIDIIVNRLPSYV